MAELICPKCKGPMRTHRRNGVTIEQCRKCHGIFLDRGELEDAITAMRARERNTSPSEVIAAAISAANLQSG
jgi:uncharacterized protein